MKATKYKQNLTKAARCIVADKPCTLSRLLRHKLGRCNMCFNDSKRFVVAEELINIVDDDE
jgi:hypothetical protein